MLDNLIKHSYSLNDDSDNWLEITPYMGNDNHVNIEYKFFNYVSNSTDIHEFNIPKDRFTLKQLLKTIEIFETERRTKLYNFLRDLENNIT